MNGFLFFIWTLFLVTIINLLLTIDRSGKTDWSIIERAENMTTASEIFETSTSSTDRLWVSLSARGEGNVFALLPEIFRKMLTRDSFLDDMENYDVVFPSDEQWKEKIYYRLVEQQRKCDAGQQMYLPEADEEKLHDWNIVPRDERAGCDEIVPSKIGRKRIKAEPKKITWTVGDLAKAGCLLHTPPIGTMFDDEQEMRRVYTLIYDVFRYKNVLMQALNDINFFQLFDSLQSSISVVWLLFYDLYHRSFKKRETSVMNLAAKLFHHAKLTPAESALWSQRVKLAAAVARLRIKYSALSLMELLPSHLRAEKLNSRSDNLPVYVWINNRKFKNANDIRKQIENAMRVKLVEDYKDLGPNNFKWDRHCPLTVSFHYSMRGQLAKSPLVRNHKLIVQDRAFCVGPATFWKVIEDLELSGSVIQTHVNSPRSTAYLANLLAQNEKIKKLMAFSAGRRKDEYENYLNDLGMTNVVIYSDRLIDFGFESACIEEVVAVYATPPNSYTAVSDPIDLVCSRGGDLSMLEILTESEDTIEGRNRVTKILEEQRKTLKFAMSRPQIQIVLYETHSELDEENEDMVSSTLKEINRLAQMHHATIQGIIGSQTKFEHVKEINNNNNGNMPRKDSTIVINAENLDNSRADCENLENVAVPDTDLFDMPELPCLCPDDDECKMENGCYLALIKRKQVLRLDNKYMIQMAEQRGLFGSNEDASKQRSSKQSRKKQQLLMKQELKPKRSRKKLKNIEMERIAAPTHSYLRHVDKSCHDCERCRHIEELKKQPTPTSSSTTPYRKWWTETTHYLSNVKQSLIRKNLIPPKISTINATTTTLSSKRIVDHLVNATSRVDELVAKHNSSNSIPIVPKLRLTRDKKEEKKVPLVVPVTLVSFPHTYCTSHQPVNFRQHGQLSNS